MALEAPLQQHEFLLSTAGKRKQRDDRDVRGDPGFSPRQGRRKPTGLHLRQEALTPVVAVAPDALTGIRSLRPIAVERGLTRVDEWNGRRPVGREDAVVERRVSPADTTCIDAANGAPTRPRQNAIFAIFAVARRHRDLPVPTPSADNFLRDDLEQGVGQCRGRYLGTTVLAPARFWCGNGPPRLRWTRPERRFAGCVRRHAGSSQDTPSRPNAGRGLRNP